MLVDFPAQPGVLDVAANHVAGVESYEGEQDQSRSIHDLSTCNSDDFSDLMLYAPPNPIIATSTYMDMDALPTKMDATPPVGTSGDVSLLATAVRQPPKTPLTPYMLYSTEVNIYLFFFLYI